MQATRENILNIIKKHGEVTVEELSQQLGLTTVTVRHHLDILRGEGLVAAPLTCRRKAPGRPKYLYALTEKASTFFPKRYDDLVDLMLSEVSSRLSADEVNQVMQHIGERIASHATIPDGGGFEARLTAAVEFLDEMGYMADWERQADGGYLLHIANCPFERVARHNPKICTIDATLLTRLIGTSPQRVSWTAQGDHQCTYAIAPAGA